MSENNYDYVSAIPKQRYLDPVSDDRMHHWRNPQLVSGEIEAVLYALRPLHLGTGNLALPADLGLTNCPHPMVKAFFRTGPDDTRAIPGSSLKGAIRSIVEAVTASCIHKARTRGRFSESVERNERECKYDTSKGSTQLCVACHIFGAMGYQGQVSFDDAPQTAGGNAVVTIPPPYQPKPGPSRRKFYYHRPVQPGVWPLEVCPPKSCFALRGHFANLTRAEVGLLLVALGEPADDGRRLCLKLGGGKNAGLGSVQVQELKLWIRQDPEDACLDYMSAQERVEASKAAFVQAALRPGGPLNEAALAELKQILSCESAGGVM